MPMTRRKPVEVQPEGSISKPQSTDPLEGKVTPENVKASISKKSTNIKLRLTQWEIKERRKKVMRLRLRGLTGPMIAKIIGIGVRQVEKDLQVIQNENAQNLDKFQQNQFVGESLAVFTELEERAWGEFSSVEEGSPARLKSLDLIREIQKDKLEALIDTGIIQKDTPSAPVHHIHSLKLDWTQEVQDKVSRALLEASFKRPVLEPSLDEESIKVIDSSLDNQKGENESERSEQNGSEQNGSEQGENESEKDEPQNNEE